MKKSILLVMTVLLFIAIPLYCYESPPGELEIEVLELNSVCEIQEVETSILEFNFADGMIYNYEELESDLDNRYIPASEIYFYNSETSNYDFDGLVFTTEFS